MSPPWGSTSFSVPSLQPVPLNLTSGKTPGSPSVPGRLYPKEGHYRRGKRPHKRRATQQEAFRFAKHSHWTKERQADITRATSTKHAIEETH